MSTAIHESGQDSGVSEATGTMEIVSFHLAEETFGVALTTAMAGA